LKCDKKVVGCKQSLHLTWIFKNDETNNLSDIDRQFEALTNIGDSWQQVI
jgi:hypothetical protein